MINHKGSIVLESERLILRPLILADAEEVFESWTSDEDVAKYLSWSVHNSIEDTKVWLTDCEKNITNPEYYNWGIVIKETGELIGSIGTVLYDDEGKMRHAPGYSIGKKYWRNGYTSEALKCMMDYLINIIGVKSFICYHAVDNPASGAVMQKVGFSYAKNGSYTCFDGIRTFQSRMYYLNIE